MSVELIKKYFPDISDKQEKQFTQLETEYKTWNEQINVISRKDIDELYVRHVLHSLSIAKFITFQPGSAILDIGTGGGFPGVPLAILFPEVNFHMVDSIGKKIKVVLGVIAALKLTNATAEHQRAEKVKGKFDFVLTRAVARSRQIWIWTNQKIKEAAHHEHANGIIALKGGDLDAEMSELKRPYQQTDISTYFKEDFFETKKIIYIPR